MVIHHDQACLLQESKSDPRTEAIDMVNMLVKLSWKVCAYFQVCF